MDSRNSADPLFPQEGVHPVPRLGRQEGVAGHGRCPVEVARGDPQDPLRVPAGPDDEEEEEGARALLPEDLPSVVGTPGPGEARGQVQAGPAAGSVRGRWEGGTPVGLPGERIAHNGVRGGRPGGVVHQVGWAGASGRLATAFHEYRDLPTFRSSSGGCRRWSAASSSDIPPGYVARAWFRYGAASPGQRVVRACSRAGALLWWQVADLGLSPAGCPPWTGAGLTGWTCATPSSTRTGPPHGL